VGKEDIKRTITEFISNNQGCTAEEIVNGLKEHISRVPIYSALKELDREGVVKDRSTSRRDHRYFIDSTNPSILIPQQLESIVKSFRHWLNESEMKWRDVRTKFSNAIDRMFEEVAPTANGSSESTLLELNQFGIQVRSPYVYYAPMLILRMIVYSVTEHAMVRWINVIRDKDTLNKLISDAFSRLAFLNHCYIDYLNNNKLPDLEAMSLQNAVAGKGFSLLMSMYACRKISIEMGLAKQTEGIFDLLWEFNKDILKFLFPEIELYKWDFKYGVDDWRRLLEIYENNPHQTLYNYYTSQGTDRDQEGSNHQEH
jgi:predicted transcriptional regulator